MNLNLYGHAGRWLMVDCGVTFNSPLAPQRNEQQAGGGQAEVLAADPAFISAQQQNLCGIVITHAHEDHIGALPQLWQRFNCPVYTTSFSAEILRRKLAGSALLEKMPIIEVQSGATLNVGPFCLHWLAITHSIPEPHALLIKTAAGTVFHTADWKMDAGPITGRAFKPAVFKRLAQHNITAMVCDSTNALREGFSVSESDCAAALHQVIKAATGRVVVSGFSSNVGRLISLARIAAKTGRYLALLGRSLNNMVGAARATGYWPDELTVVDAGHIGYLPKEEVLVIATGSQGEPRAALSRLADDNHPLLLLEQGDLVIFSSIIIPGNEMLISRLVEKFNARNIQTLQSHNTALPIHVSGHPNRGELDLLYRWVQPQIAVPVHGEAAHLAANATVAKAAGVPQQLTGLNGDLFVLAPTPRLWPGFAKTGRIAINSH
ncbi:ribonuclease J [Rheinheimera sp.]|uniref:ribonuclease J n=1 Tax=Rheinheimera sp. TaxID=1869214 RepID=UPI002733BA87|nr:ribonuclease J [Rheinheimera sp.]MDP2713313.1 ribonuclease J [Rheinheimera sp.]